MTKLEYIEFTGSVAIDTGIYADINTEVECWLIPVSVTATYWDCFFGTQQQDDANDTFQLRRYDRQYKWIPRFFNYQPNGTGFGEIVNGDEYHILLNNNALFVNDTNLCNMLPAGDRTSYYTLYFGGTHNNQGIFRPYNCKWIRFIVRNNGTVQGDFIPVLDDNDEPCFYDSVSGNYFYKTGTGTFTAGPVATTITTEPTVVGFDFTGGSETVTVYSTAGNWTASTLYLPSWITISPLTGANGETTTITAAPITSSGQQGRFTILNIANEEEAANIYCSQQGTGDLIFRNFIMFNDRGLNKEYLETHNIMKMFYNGREVFRRVSFIPTLSVSTNDLTFPKTGGTNTVEITSNTTWSASTSASWLTITTAATGISVAAADYSSGQTERTATITVTASNGDFSVSETISVTQRVANYTELAWISIDGLGWNVNAYIETEILITNGTEIRLGYSGTSSTGNNDRLVGYTWQDKDIYGQAISDSHDYRIFGYSNGSFDVDSARNGGLGLNNNGEEYDITLGNYFVYDNKSERYKLNGTTQNVTTEATCKVDISTSRIQFVYIYENGTEVFHGVPAMDGNGNIGLWDDVSDQLFYNPDYTMDYGTL